MLAHRNGFSLWLLLLLCVSGSAMRLRMFGDESRRNPAPREGDVRLFGGVVSEGRVEIYHDGKWGTVCDDGWDMAEAQVVCRQLHFPGANAVVFGKNYGKVSGPIWLDDLSCQGTESYLSKCAFTSWGVTDCSHKEDVGVICETSNSNLTKSDSLHSLDHSISLSDERGEIFDSSNGCDFLILVQSASENVQDDGTQEVVETPICAHKHILSQFPLFNASEGINNITVKVSQSCQPHVTTFIRYIYTRKADIAFSSMQCLHWLAYTFGVEELMEDTGRLFSKILPEDASFQTQVSLYKYALETGDFVLEENCLQYLAWNYQNLTMSPAWTHISIQLLGSLLLRSDLVVPDEYVLLQTVESWIEEKGNSTPLDTQHDLLSRIRFPMIPAEALYDLEFNSSLYSSHKNLYQENLLEAYQFNMLLFSNLKSNPKFSTANDHYQTRIYTAKPWSTVITAAITPLMTRYNNYYQYNQIQTQLNVPIHNSLIFKNNRISWGVNILRNQQECSNQGLSCSSFPVARLYPQEHPQNQHILFRNRLLLICQGKYICQIQDFKDNMAYISVNETQGLTFPCPDAQFSYHFVVRPGYV
ncbi:galectin-3-binding protein A-like [Pseudochaenichthys georgianus]|uniref:galectin-3-binding protein A-like n=1 Tax=Pseudochaenichthys georgianus TaxID=52239 RepID=UPI00146D948B|nr:galectin-3-binding protein A-like [Pseudochaenichthys georgianus]